VKNKEFLEERRIRLLEYINRNNRAGVGELAAKFNVPEATIRRDLLYMESENLIYRTHGGALRREQPSLWKTTTLHERSIQHRDEKERIGDLVEQLVHDGESIMIDAGSTTLQAAVSLGERKNLLVVTNAPDIARLMVEVDDNKVILTGGELARETRTLVGSAAEASLRQYRVDKAIVGASGIIPGEGCFSAIPQEAEIKRLMSLSAAETIVVCDSSKIGARALCFFCDLRRVGRLVTDRGITPAALDEMKQQGVEVFAV